MKILICHNYYQIPGGEDNVFKNESFLLEQRGHQVFHYIKDNKIITQKNFLRLAFDTIFNRKVYNELKNILEEIQPDIVHFHNTFPLISPSAYYAVKKLRIPVIQTLHNYRLLCINGYLYREGAVCELCIRKKFKWPGLLYKCYRDNIFASFAVVLMLFIHNILKTWGKVDQFIVLSQFEKSKFIQSGFPENKITIKYNSYKKACKHAKASDKYILYSGRLSEEKGIFTLLDSLKYTKNIQLKISGTSIIFDEIQNKISSNSLQNVHILGQLSYGDNLQILSQAYILIYPSHLFEAMSLSIIEAFANGIPVIASNHGSMAELVTHNETGLLFETGNPKDLAKKINWANNHPKEIKEMGKNAKIEFYRKYTEEISYQKLMTIYNSAIQLNKRGK